MALGTKLLIILISISIALTLSGYTSATGIAGTDDDISTNFGITYNYTNESMNTTGINETGEGIHVQTNQTGVIGGIINFFDRFSNVQDFIGKIFTFFKAPIAVLQSIEGTPQALIYLVGVIWGILWAIAIASFIWRTPF